MLLRRRLDIQADRFSSGFDRAFIRGFMIPGPPPEQITKWRSLVFDFATS